MKTTPTYKCLIIDDEQFARELIADYLKSFPEFEVVGKCKNTLMAKEVLASEDVVDVIFLDIQMPEETGIEFLKKHSVQPKIVFTTAYAEYAVESYHFDVADYLLKPITEERFGQMIQKLKKQLDTEEKAKAFELLEIIPNDAIKIKTGASTVKIYFNELLHLQAEGEYIKYITKDKSYLVLGSLKKIAEELPPLFIQVHRSHIVALSKVKERKNYTLFLHDQSQIPIGKTYRSKVLERLKEINF
ncbi:LytR/AlgR family response regulator transcription factor [Flammeovirga agarivorans]|uniref:Response regulator transcription factor n=1 Tax=Flammeovirga agarivorans TaxID=2726742 RepID=A0A7X8SK66_9BACT|nr:LytTR family DNA-binding domain-containing protein [Flammeovirga agarivorans]NLR91675.1 response regulator transcription factor [Flammeovirga agarivorans]